MQTSSAKYWGHNVRHDDYSSHCWMVYLKATRRVNPKTSSNKREKTFFTFFSVSKR